MTLTRKDADRIAAAVKTVAVLPGADKATIDAIAQSLAMTFDDQVPVAFRTACTGRINLSGRDEIANLKVARFACEDIDSVRGWLEINGLFDVPGKGWLGSDGQREDGKIGAIKFEGGQFHGWWSYRD